MRLSIITVNYNNKNGLQKTIDSVLTQTWIDFEWIVIDGGSMDGSKELILQYKNHFSYWCSEPDKGVYNAMNKGVSQAHGEYCVFLNSGDMLYDSEVLEKIDKCGWKSDIISGQVLRMDNGLLLRKYNEDIVKQLLFDTLNHQGTFIKRSLFDTYRYREDYKIVADWLAWIQWLLRENHSIECIDVIIACQDMNGISSNSNDIMIKERQRGLNEILGGRVTAMLLHMYEEQKFLDWPIVKDIRFLASNTHYSYSILIRIVNGLMMIHHFLFRHIKK